MLLSNMSIKLSNIVIFSLLFTLGSCAPNWQSGSLASFFPPASVVGNAGPTPTGNEPFEIATGPAAPYQTGYFPLVSPQAEDAAAGFDPLGFLGNLSPKVSLPSTTFSPELANSSALIPPQCTLNQVHLLHRHGARYPTSDSDPQGFGDTIANPSGTFTATGPLAFLNAWEYGLGAEILTPFGRQDMFNLGVTFRLEYGHLLDAFPNGTLPVFRTTSNDRMVMSALNFAAGFFGIPFGDAYYEEITIEADTGNNTLAPNCLNADGPLGNGGGEAVLEWINIYLNDTANRLNGFVSGLTFSPVDAFIMQELCAYETVAVGSSDFCPLFTAEEFKGFEYAIDLEFWYGVAFGAPFGAATGIGWVQELVSRLTQTPISEYNSTTNSTLDSSPITFPLNQPIYVDATHDGTVSAILVALNFTSLAVTGPLPTDHIPSDRSFIISQQAPFATQLVAQILTCEDTGASIRWLLNDASLPMTNIPGCGSDSYGRCSLDAFISAMKQRIEEVDYGFDCLANYTISDVVAAGITDGRPPQAKE